MTPAMFTAKNNLVLARGAQRKYDLPVIEMTQTERAELLYTLGLTAIKQGRCHVGKALLRKPSTPIPSISRPPSAALPRLES